MRKLKRTKKINFNEKDNNILWQYKIPLFKLKRNIIREDISEIRFLRRRCRCELRNDFKYLMDRSTYWEYKYTCSNCNLVHNIVAKSLDDFYGDLKRRLALIENKKQFHERYKFTRI